jgi:aarF domain-containing kinase
MSLGGFYYKNGQKIASNMSGIAPKIYQDMFQPFLNDIPARSPANIRAVVEGELGKPREEVFSTWDDTPIGCASIGQVHRATLKSTGQRVVVKVQNPDAERTFVGDVFALKVLVDMFMPQLSPAFEEIEKQFKTEFDYRGEMQNAKEIRDNLKKDFPNIIVPYVYDEFCTKKLMVMEEVRPSIPLHDALDEQAERMARSQGMTKEEFVEKEKIRVEEEVRINTRHLFIEYPLTLRSPPPLLLVPDCSARQGRQGRQERQC